MTSPVINKSTDARKTVCYLLNEDRFLDLSKIEEYFHVLKLYFM